MRDKLCNKRFLVCSKSIDNVFITPLIVMSDVEMFTLPLGLNTFKGQYISYWNYIMAASIVFTMPVLILYAFFNRYFVKGKMMGSSTGYRLELTSSY